MEYKLTRLSSCIHRIPSRRVSTTRICANVAAPGNVAAPDDHLGTGPDRGVIASSRRQIQIGCWYPVVGNRIISGAGSLIKTATPDDHLGPGPNCGVTAFTGWSAIHSERLPGIRGQIVDAPGIDGFGVPATPDDHLCTGPDS